MIVKTNAVPSSILKKAKTMIESENFSWFYTCNTAYTNKEETFGNMYNSGFGHIAYLNNRKNSESADVLEDCLLFILDGMNKELEKIHRIRIGLIPVNGINSINPPHVDVPHNHSVGLLYLNDSDGDTIIYNEKFDPYDTYDVASYYTDYLKSNVTEMHRVTPEENKFVLFNGLHYHSSSTPVKTKRRIVVNYVFECYDR